MIFSRAESAAEYVVVRGGAGLVAMTSTNSGLPLRGPLVGGMLTVTVVSPRVRTEAMAGGVPVAVTTHFVESVW